MSLTANISGVQELTATEMKDTNGGLIWLAIPAALLLAGCATTGTNSTETPVNSASGPA